MTESSQIMIFTRYPEPGRTKTRLIPALGAEGAARLHCRMTEHILEEALALARRQTLLVSVHYEGGSRQRMSSWLGKEAILQRQVSGNLGRRMQKAFKWVFDRGARQSVLVGSDIPGLDRAIMEQALDHLERRDLVLGPARDGGYYLIGMNHTVPANSRNSLFASMPWGTGEILSRTLEAARRAGLSFSLLPPLHDLDRPADLVRMKGELIAKEP